MNKKKIFSWKYGHKKWNRVSNYIILEDSGKILGTKGSNETLDDEVILWPKENMGTANQKWYFKSLVSTFVIASLDHRDKVLDIVESTKGKPLCANCICFTGSQVWYMDSMGCLESQTEDGLVADIYGANKDPGSKVIGSIKNDEQNQFWTFQDGRIISNLNGLAMERDGKHFLGFS